MGELTYLSRIVLPTLGWRLPRLIDVGDMARKRKEYVCIKLAKVGSSHFDDRRRMIFSGMLENLEA